MERILSLALTAAVTAAALCGCGKSAPPETEPDTLYTHTQPTAEAPGAGEQDEDPKVLEEPDTHYYDEAEEEENGDDSSSAPSDTAELSPDKSSVDMSKPYVPEEIRGLPGKTVYSYPVNSIMLTLREAPSEEAKKSAEALAGTSLTLYANCSFSHAECWSYVTFDGGKGWCPANLITHTPCDWLDFTGVALPAKCYDHSGYNDGIYVTETSLPLYVSPSDSSEKRADIPAGAEIRAFGDDPSEKGWLFISVNDSYLTDNSGGDVVGYEEIFGWIYSGKDKHGGKSPISFR